MLEEFDNVYSTVCEMKDDIHDIDVAKKDLLNLIFQIK